MLAAGFGTQRIPVPDHVVCDSGDTELGATTPRATEYPLLPFPPKTGLIPPWACPTTSAPPTGRPVLTVSPGRSHPPQGVGGQHHGWVRRHYWRRVRRSR